ncbi:hypothetical protein ACXC9Q_18800 [Kribbella sp. CWNU-51]
MAIAIAGLSVARAFGRINHRVELVRSTAADHQRAIATLADNDTDGRRAAENSLKDARRLAGVGPDTSWDDIAYMKTLITHAIAEDARSGLIATVWLIGLGVLLSTAGSAVSAFG